MKSALLFVLTFCSALVASSQHPPPDSLPDLEANCPLTPLQIFALLQKQGFTAGPVTISGLSAKQALLKAMANDSNYIEDYAGFVIILDNESVDFSSDNVPDVATSKVYVTKNENFCAAGNNIIDHVSHAFIREHLFYVTWYHIWKNPDPAGPDALMFRQWLRKD